MAYLLKWRNQTFRALHLIPCSLSAKLRWERGDERLSMKTSSSSSRSNLSGQDYLQATIYYRGHGLLGPVGKRVIPTSRANLHNTNNKVCPYLWCSYWEGPIVILKQLHWRFYISSNCKKLNPKIIVIIKENAMSVYCDKRCKQKP